MNCENCGKILTTQKRFCSHSCRAKTVNVGRVVKTNPEWHRPLNPCKQCGTPTTNTQFCDQVCRNQYQADVFAAGQVKDRITLRKHLAAGRDPGCFVCGLNEWRGSPLSLEVDHIDGDASNNLPANLQLVCPNCHSITPTWKGRNKGKGRKTRGLPTH